jgi:hypothetical protein
MITRFVCLANSFKEGGRCLAGVVLDIDNIPVIENNKPKWIRPVCNTLHGEIPNKIAYPFQILDIIEIENITSQPYLYQSENVLFNENTIKKIGLFEKQKLQLICENSKYIFKTRYSSLSEEVIQELDHSLMLIKPDKFEVIDKVYEDRTIPQQRMVFQYNGFNYDFSITDPVFLRSYQTNHEFILEFQEVILCLSVGVKYPATNRYYKLVAGVIKLNELQAI